jgi:hypothetical protein
MRLKPLLLPLLLVTLAALGPARAASNGQTNLIPNHSGDAGASDDRVTLQAILVIASDDGETDPSLAPYEATLKRVLRFKSFRRVGGATAAPLAAKQEATLAIGGGYSLDVWINWITDRETEFGARWFTGKATLANTTITRPRQSTAIIGGPAAKEGGGTYAVIIVAR